MSFCQYPFHYLLGGTAGRSNGCDSFSWSIEVGSNTSCQCNYIIHSKVSGWVFFISSTLEPSSPPKFLPHWAQRAAILLKKTADWNFMKSFSQSLATALHKRLPKVLLAEIGKSYVGHLNKCLQRVLFQMLLIIIVQEKLTASWRTATEILGVKEYRKENNLKK